MGVVYNYDNKDHHPGMTHDSFIDALKEASKKEDFIKHVKYYVHGSEICPTTGTKHLQCFFIFKNDQSLSNLMTKFSLWLDFKSTIAFKKADSNTAECIDYCEKDGKDIVEFGTRPKGKGHRSDLDAVAQSISAGCNMSELFDLHPSSFLKYAPGMQKAVGLKSAKRDWKTEVYWIHGPTGTGKSRWVFQTCDRSNLYVKDGNSKWFDGYLGEANVLFDDFRPTKELPFSYFLRLLDRYPMTVEGKGCSINFAPERIFITTPMPPTETFSHLDWIKEEDIGQLTRRITQVIHMEANTITQFALLPPFVKTMNDWTTSVGQQTRVPPVAAKTPSKNSSRQRKSQKRGDSPTQSPPVIVQPASPNHQSQLGNTNNSQSEDDSSVDMDSLSEISGDEEPSDAESIRSEARSLDSSQATEDSFIVQESEADIAQTIARCKKAFRNTSAKTAVKPTKRLKSSGKNKTLKRKSIQQLMRERDSYVDATSSSSSDEN